MGDETARSGLVVVWRGSGAERGVEALERQFTLLSERIPARLEHDGQRPPQITLSVAEADLARAMQVLSGSSDSLEVPRFEGTI